MQAEQIVLLIAVAALAVALLVVVVSPRLRGGVRAELPDTTTKPVPIVTEQELSARNAVGPPTPPPPPNHVVVMVCPTCRRQYAAGLRFCPYDARLLVPAVPAGQSKVQGSSDALAAHGKICPHCARRYDSIATVCGRDGEALVSVN